MGSFPVIQFMFPATMITALSNGSLIWRGLTISPRSPGGREGRSPLGDLGGGKWGRDASARRGLGRQPHVLSAANWNGQRMGGGGLNKIEQTGLCDQRPLADSGYYTNQTERPPITIKTLLSIVHPIKSFVYHKVSLVREKLLPVIEVQVVPRKNARPICSNCRCNLWGTNPLVFVFCNW